MSNKHEQYQSSVLQMEKDEEKNGKRITLKIKKKSLKGLAILTVVLVVFVGVGLSQTRSITGTWVRVNDDNGLVGMMVNVHNGNGTIISIPDGLTTGYNFKVDQIKWNGIKRKGWGVYSMYDLVAPDDGGEPYYDSTSTITVALNGKKLILQVDDVSGRSAKSGLYQEWERKK